MKQNKIENPKRRFGLLAVLALGVGLTVAYGKLRALWLEQCVLTDVARQVAIADGKMVKADVLLAEFGLVPGANLATIDFGKRRAEVLEKIPNLRTLQIVRHLPDRVEITFEEREPVARMNLRGNRRETGRVVDSEGVVFIRQRDTQMLPTIREAQAPGTPAGKTLSGRARAALQLLETVRESAFAELGVIEVDISKPDFLMAVLGNYSRLKISWPGMDERTPAGDAYLRRKLEKLVLNIRTRIAADAVIWNATDDSDQCIITADTKGNL